jgi:predicted transposase/invertase (TIGR01784 family)
LEDKWIFFLKNAKNLDIIPENIDDEGLKRAYEFADTHSWTREELKAYDYAAMRKQDERGILQLALRRGMEKAKAEGKAEGKEEEKLEILKNGIKEGLSNELLQKMTGVSEDTIEQIRNDLKG